MSKNGKIIEIEQLIIDNQLIQAMELIKAIFDEYNDEELINESILVFSRVNNFQDKINQGLVNIFDLEFSRIRLSVINLKSSAKKILNSPKKYQNKNSKGSHSSTMIYEEDFEELNLDWKTFGEIKFSLKNGRCFLDYDRNEKAGTFEILANINTKRNFQVTASTMFFEGSNSSAYGIIWGSGKGMNYFNFLISPNGKFRIGYFMENEYFSICDWNENPAINSGKNINVLEILKSDELMHFKINKEVVFTSNFISFFGYNIGIILYRNMKVVVDYFRITN